MPSILLYLLMTSRLLCIGVFWLRVKPFQHVKHFYYQFLAQNVNIIFIMFASLAYHGIYNESGVLLSTLLIIIGYMVDGMSNLFEKFTTLGSKPAFLFFLLRRSIRYSSILSSMVELPGKFIGTN
jgi:hypothetical protein